MKAVILAAGKGTRMKELTNEVPKPMLRVDGKPILQHIVEGLRDAAKIRELCIITGWKAEVTENYFGDGAAFGVTVSYARQVVQAGTGKAPELANAFVGSYNAGIYMFRPLLFDFTARLHKSPRGEYELTDAIGALVAAGHRIAGLEIVGRWVDVRDPEVLAALEQGRL